MKSIILYLLTFTCALKASENTNFLLYDLNAGKWLIEEGHLSDERFPPCSTFKLFLSLIGFDAGILIDEDNPRWEFQEGYADFLPIWKNPHTPKLWMRNSCLWFSQVLTTKLGMPLFQHYIDLLEYGNRDLSGESGKNNGLTRSWLESSLKISPREQIAILSKMLQNTLPISSHAVEMTRQIAFLEDLDNGWKLYGKTGSEAQDTPYFKAGWFIGWLENEQKLFPFVYYLRTTEETQTFGGLIAKERAKKLLAQFLSH